jgi:sarcosine oxidase gamma subunit
MQPLPSEPLSAILSMCRRYLEMQAASFQSYLCPVSSPVAASVLDTAPQAAAAAAAAAGPDATWSQPGPYVIVDTSTAAAAAAAAAGVGSGGVDVSGALRGLGCERMQSFILLDIKWSLQAQV